MATRVDPGVAKRWGFGRSHGRPTVPLADSVDRPGHGDRTGRVGALIPPPCGQDRGTRQFTVSHDAAHRAVQASSTTPWALGHGPVAPLAVPKIHLHHHAHTNDPAEDPDFWVVGRTWPGTLARFFTTWPHYYRFYFTRLVAKDGVLLQTVAGILLLLAVLGASFVTGHLGAALLYWVLPAQLAVAALALLFDYLPHRPTPERPAAHGGDRRESAMARRLGHGLPG
jgi:fatty acid desaturase